MKNPISQGASLSHRYLQSLLAIGLAIAFASCKKDKEAPAVIEEVPSTATMETDTSATLAEEPNLQAVGQDQPGTATNTFHPSGSQATEAGFSESGHYVVQVAVFKSKRQAANLVEKLANSGYPAYVAEVENPVPALEGTYHRVRIGKFRHISDAKAFGDNTLKPLGYDYWVDNKKNDAVGGDGYGYSAPAPAEPAYNSSTPAEPATPASESWGTPSSSEPAAPSGETWGTPASSEPATPAGDSWGTPSSESTTPTTTPSEPAATPSEPATLPSEPANAPDTGKVNLDDW